MTARLSYLSREISVGAVALCIRRLGDSIVVRACMHATSFVYTYAYRELSTRELMKLTIRRFIVLVPSKTDERMDTVSYRSYSSYSYFDPIFL